MKTYEMYRAACPKTIEVALQVVESHHVDLDLHGWARGPDRGDWLKEYSYFFVLFLDGEYRGFAAVVNYEDGHYLHFGCVKSGYAMKDVLFSLDWLQRSLPRSYGIRELKCCIDSDHRVGKLIGKLGFNPAPDSSDTYTRTL